MVEDTLLLDESKDFSFIKPAKQDGQKKQALDITFAATGAKNQHLQRTSSSSQRSSMVSKGRLSKGSSGRARWSLPSDVSLNEGMTMSDHQQDKKSKKGMTSEDLMLDQIKQQRAEKNLLKSKTKTYYAKMSSKLGQEVNQTKQAVTQH